MSTKESSAEKLLQIIEEKEQRIAELKQQLKWLTSQIHLHKHNKFSSSSEKTDENQLCIFNEAEANSVPVLPEPKLTEVKAHYRKKTRLTTDKLPEDIPVEIVVHELPEEKCICPGCGDKLHKMGKETVNGHDKIDIRTCGQNLGLPIDRRVSVCIQKKNVKRQLSCTPNITSVQQM